MKTVKINAISPIDNDKDGNPLNIVVLSVVGRPAIIRNQKQFILDLQNSFLIGRNVNSMNHASVLKVMKDLSTGYCLGTGNITFAKEGDKWEVTENSRVVTDKTHPDFGKYQVGDMATYKTDMTLVTEGFLNLNYNDVVAQRKEDSYAKAINSVGALEDLLSDNVETVSTGSEYGGDAPEFDPANIPDEVVNQATAQEAK